jgi:hypothetical protein
MARTFIVGDETLMLLSLDALAAQHRLGEYESTHPYNSHYLLWQCAIAFAAIVGTLLLVFTVMLFVTGIVPAFSYNGVNRIIGPLFFTCIALCLIVSVTYYSIPILRQLLLFFWEGMATIIMYTDGFIYVSKHGTEVVRWEQVDIVWQRFATTSGKGNSHALNDYTLRCEDGRLFQLNRVFRDVHILSNKIPTRVMPRLLQELLNSYQYRETLAFGKLAMSHQGLGWKRRFLPWHLFERYYVSNDSVLVIFKRGWFPAWKSISLSKIPNVFALLYLLQMQRGMQNTINV